MNNNIFFKVGNMPYVSRGADGLVSAILLKSQPDATEFLPNDHPDILQFLGVVAPNHLDKAALGDLNSSDASFIRVIEDVIELLIAKKVLTFTELPEMVREKILSRKGARDRLANSNDIMFTDEGIL